MGAAYKPNPASSGNSSFLAAERVRELRVVAGILFRSLHDLAESKS
jgi:hypothetical protein